MTATRPETIAPERIKTEALQRIHAYWQGLSAQGVPARRDVDPVRMPRGDLRHLVLVERLDLDETVRYRYRLAGTEVVSSAGFDPTGRFVDQLPGSSEYVRHIVSLFDLTRTWLAPIYAEGEFVRDNAYGQVRQEAFRLLLPLTDQRDRLTHVLGAQVFSRFLGGTGPAQAPGAYEPGLVARIESDHARQAA